MRITLEKLLNIDYEYVTSEICAFIKKQVQDGGLRGAVIGLSGGIDSSTTAFLTARALGAENVLGLIMPYRTTPKEDVEDAKKIAEILGIRYVMIDISEIRDSYARSIPDFDENDRIAAGNLLPRIRMMLLYYYANKYRYIVVGTGDRSELLIGYFTKYGDGGVDILPIGSLYKTQVRMLGKYLGVPDNIVNKPSSPRLWPGHLAEEELGLKYEEIDLILHALFDLGLDIDETVRATGLSREKVVKVLEMYERSKHKRRTPPAPVLDPSRMYKT
ncbi:MAG: NAD+ synthase [Crenarchaeota archaeon]|nr:NAD+ synthase [Thermoproteota archaeon]